MYIPDRIAAKFHDPFNVCAVFSVVLGISALFAIGPWRTLALAVFGLCLIYLGVVSLTRLARWYSTRTGVRTFLRRDEIPRKYHPIATYAACATPTATLEIAGRTCISWLCGSERDVETDDNQAKQQKEKLHAALLSCIASGATVRFYMQNPLLPFPLFTQQKRMRLRKHAEVAIGAYEEVWNRIPSEQRPRLVLFLVNEWIDNSMVRLSFGGKVERTVLDLSAQFRAPGGAVSKPLLIVETRQEDTQQFLKEEFDRIAQIGTPLTQWKKEKEELIGKAKQIISAYTHHSNTRNDRSSAIALLAARHYTEQSATAAEIAPPVSAQFLITNNCTTQCAMCDHYKLGEKTEGLALGEKYEVLRMIKELGTESLIVSGGEPLADNDLAAFVKRAKGHELNVGLLTSGVCPGGSPVAQQLAMDLASNCAWIQVSIDSFAKDIYKEIRGQDYLDVALDSVKALYEAKVERLEVCVTIQKANISEIPSMPEEITRRLPPSVDVRFKFAHGPANGRDYLPTSNEITTLWRALTPTTQQYNWGYLVQMLQDRHFDVDGLSRGVPLEAKMHDYSGQRYTCHALRLTCVIDANGDVYPCCFLFDDNRASSIIRSSYRLGSLRQEGMAVPSDGNPLAEIWNKSERLRSLRSQVLPIDRKACGACIRHFYQNELMNSLWSVFEEGKLHGVAEAIRKMTPDSTCQPVWV